MSRSTVPKTILIAGIASLLGAKLAENLLDLGFEVIGIDNLLSGSKENIENLLLSPHFNFLEVDLTRKLPAIAYKGDLLALVHVANIESYALDSSYRLNSLLVDSLGVKNLLDFAIRKKSRFIFASSIDIYEGLANRLSLDHYYGDRETNARFSFLEAKRFSESLCQEYYQTFKADIRVARFGEVYGPRMNLNANSVVARILRLGIENKDLIIDEDGSSEHLLIYVDDAAFGLAKLIISDNQGLKGSIFYFLNPEHVSILSIAYTVKEILGTPLKVEFLPKFHLEVNPSWTGVPASDLERTKKILGWEPRVSLTDGLRESLDFYKKTTLNDKGDEPSPEKKADQPSATVEKQKNNKEDEEPLLISTTQKKDKELVRERKGSLFAGLSLTPPNILKGLEVKKGTSSKKTTIRGWLKAVFISLLSLVLVLSLTEALLLIGIKSEFGQIKDAWSRNDPSRLGTSFTTTRRFLEVQRLVLLSIKPFSYLIGMQVTMTDYSELTAGLIDLLDPKSIPFEKVIDLKKNIQKIADSSPLLGHETVKNNTLSGLLKDDIEAIHLVKDNFDRANSHFNNVDLSKLKIPFMTSDNLVAYKDLLFWFPDLLENLDSVKDDLPLLLGEGIARKYLFLFQNNNELRATGGFIGSLAVLTVENDALVSFVVNDVYNPDGLLTVKLPAPTFLQEHLSISDIGIRDANYSPSFSDSAQRIIFLYKNATHESLDGVFALNLSVLEDVLRATGPIYVPSYQENIDASNVFSKAEIHSEVGFKPGSSQKLDFLSNLAQGLIGVILKENKFDTSLLAYSFIKGLNQKDILLYFNEPKVETDLSNSFWLGQMRQNNGDYLWLIDSNVGANKSNYWVTRSEEYTLDVDRDGNLSANLGVTWKHTGPSKTWPDGEYDNYFRVYVPLGSKLTKITGADGEIETLVENDKTVFTAFVKVDINSEKTINISYVLPPEIGFHDNSQYSLLLQKQSGLKDELFSFKLNLPSYLGTKDQTSWIKPITSDVDFGLTVVK